MQTDELEVGVALPAAELDALRHQLAATTAWIRLADNAIDDAASLLIDGLTRTPLGVLRDYQSKRQACVEAATGGTPKAGFNNGTSLL